MKIVNFKKFLRGVLMVFVCLLIISFFITKNSFSYNTKTFKTVYVCQGDTLWSIAEDLQDTNYYKGKDIRYIIDDIKKINNLQNSNLMVGDELIFPVI